jgi:hypothetical protein
MQTWKFSVAVMAFASGVIAVGCGDDDGDSDEATGGRNNSATGGRNGSTGGRATTGGTQGEDGGAPPVPTDGGAPDCQGSLLDTFVPQTTDQDPGPECQAYADCMEEGCGELYEPAFGADWADGDLSGGACGASVPCLEDCGCDATCAQNCIFTNLECATYALQLQSCYMGCAAEFMACQDERM